MSDQGNPLSAPPPSVPDGHDPLLATVKQAHSVAAAQVSKLAEAKGMVDHIRTQLSELEAMGDNVTPEDVIKGAGNIVAKGGDPMQLATLLADMPQGGQAIAAWVQQHVQSLGANEQKLDQQLALARHSAGAAALHLIAMHHIGEQFKAGASALPEQNAETSNALN